MARTGPADAPSALNDASETDAAQRIADEGDNGTYWACGRPVRS